MTANGRMIPNSISADLIFKLKMIIY